METRLKERLVGAIVLVAIVVIVVPELLTGPRSGAPDAAPESAGAAPVRTVIIDLDSGQRSTTATPERAAAATPPTTSAPVVDPSEPSRSPPASGARTGDAVQPDAARVASEPAPRPSVDAPAGTASLPAAPDAGTTRSGAAVAPTPAPSATPTPSSSSPPKPAASQATTPATESAPQSRAAASPSTQDAAPPRPKPSGGTSGWVVQLGSFASRPNAEKLAAELRGSGYAAFVSEFRGSGRVLYRVRVGPEQDRGRADALAARLAREGRKGTVAPHP
jgi:DedD protein